MTAARAVRVLHVIPSLDLGGTERQLTGYIARSSDPEAHLVATFDRLGPLAHDLPVPPVLLGPVVRRSWRFAPSVARTVLDLRRQAIRWRADVVHAHLGAAELLAAIGTPRHIPVVASRRGRNLGFERSRTLHLVEGLGHLRVDLMACNSEYLADHTRSHDLWPPPIVVTPNGVDLDRFAPTPLPGPPPVVAFIANAYPYKRPLLFLDAFRTLRERVPDATAVVVGRAADVLGPEAGDLVRKGAVRLVGQADDTRPYLAGAHLVALTSEHEGFPNVLLEAMASGRPVVSTAVGGVPELVRDGVDGLLVPPDGTGLAQAMERILTEASLRERMAASVRERAESFGWRRAVEDREGLFVRAIEIHARRRRYLR